MILGHGTAATDEAVIAEFHQLVEETGHLQHANIIGSTRRAPFWMGRQIQKPILCWGDEDILHAYHQQPPSRIRACNVFVAFLIFRGYHRPSLDFLLALPTQLSCQFRPALWPGRRRLQEAHDRLGYQCNDSRDHGDRLGSEMELYLWLLAISHTTPEQITRADFDRFKDTYQRWYRDDRRRSDGRPNAHVYHLEQLLVSLGDIPAEKKMGPREAYLAHFPHPLIREAIVQYLNWCQVKHKLKSIYDCQKALYWFLQWLAEHYPMCSRLDEITRSMALEYVNYLKHLYEQKRFGALHRRKLHLEVIRLFEFAVEEQLEASPDRNPFAKSDLPKRPEMIPRYLPDHDLRTILTHCETDATLLERTITIILLHTGIRASELAALKASDLVQIAGRWKLHIHEGKGLKDRIIPLTEQCVKVLQAWMESGWKRSNDFLFTHYGRPWVGGHTVGEIMREMTRKLGLKGVTPHRFRHTFAVALLNYGIRESALQKLMGHATLGMTLEYAHILDETVERSFSQAVEQMQEGALSWVPNFFTQGDYTQFAEGDTVSWIQLPLGFCRRNPKLHCESDVKCLLCERFYATAKDLPRLRQMHERFMSLGLQLKADVVATQIQQIEARPPGDTLPAVKPPTAFIPLATVAVSASK